MTVCLGAKTWPCYNQNCVITSRVIKGLKCISYFHFHIYLQSLFKVIILRLWLLIWYIDIFIFDFKRSVT